MKFDYQHCVGGGCIVEGVRGNRLELEKPSGHMYSMNFDIWYGRFRLARRKILKSLLRHSALQALYKLDIVAPLWVPNHFSIHLDVETFQSLPSCLLAS